MKRSGFQQKPRKPLKRTPLRSKSRLKKKSKTDIAKLKDKLWELCKQIIRRRYGNSCYTCPKTGLEKSNWHTGHFIPSASGGAILRYDLRNLRPQCYHCNINHSGNGAFFYRRLVEDEGQEYVDKLFQDKNIIVKADAMFYNSLIEKYEKILEEINRTTAQ